MVDQEEIFRKLKKDYADPMKKMKEAERLLEEKYGEKFVAERYAGQRVLDSFFTVVAYAKSYPYVLFRVFIDTDGEMMTDEYVGRRISCRLAETLQSRFRKLPGMYYVAVMPMDYLFIADNADVSFEALGETDFHNRYTIYIFATGMENSDPVFYKHLSGIFEGLDFLQGTLELYFTDEKGIEKIQEYVEVHELFYDEFNEMIKSSFVGEIPFSHGRLDMAQANFVNGEGDIYE